MNKEQALSKAISTRVHQLEGQKTDWGKNFDILLMAGKKEDLLHVIFTAMNIFANDVISYDNTLHKKITDRIAELKKDDRLYYPPATVFANSPLALIQTSLEAQLHLCERLLNIPLSNFPLKK